jgi:hypothetical protein
VPLLGPEAPLSPEPLGASASNNMDTLAQLLARSPPTQAPAAFCRAPVPTMSSLRLLALLQLPLLPHAARAVSRTGLCLHPHPAFLAMGVPKLKGIQRAGRWKMIQQDPTTSMKASLWPRNMTTST